MTTRVRNNQGSRVLKGIRLGIARALTRSMQTGRTHATRAVADNLGARQSGIRRRLILDKASAQKLNTTLRFTGKRLRLIDLGARETRKGVTIRGEGGGRQLIPGAFKATVGVGRHTGVFKRIHPTRSRRGKPRSSPALPITELFAVSVPFVATKNQILESTLEVAVQAFAKNAARDVQFATR